MDDTLMTLPTVNILGLTYTVERVPCVANDEYAFGEIDIENQPTVDKVGYLTITN